MFFEPVGDLNRIEGLRDREWKQEIARGLLRWCLFRSVELPQGLVQKTAQMATRLALEAITDELAPSGVTLYPLTHLLGRATLIQSARYVSHHRTDPSSDSPFHQAEGVGLRISIARLAEIADHPGGAR